MQSLLCCQLPSAQERSRLEVGKGCGRRHIQCLGQLLSCLQGPLLLLPLLPFLLLQLLMFQLVDAAPETLGALMDMALGPQPVRSVLSPEC
jgi:hypothetical protein